MPTLTKICITALLVAVATPALAASLSDIGNSNNKTAIEYLSDKGVIGGYPDGTFRPLNTVNRAELLKILVGGQGAAPTVDTYNNCFPDVTNEWFAPFVCYAKEQGWVGGYPDGTFRPANTVNTVEAIKMVVNAQGYQVPESVPSYQYDDVDNAAWYAPYVKAAKDKGILEPISGNLGTASDMKRGSISEVIYRSMYVREQALDRFPAEQNAAENTTYDYDVSRIDLSGMVTNWDGDAEDDGVELSAYFYFKSRTNTAEPEQMGPPKNQDWSVNVSIYDRVTDDDYKTQKGKLLYQGNFTGNQVMYDSSGYPFVRIPIEQIQDAGKTMAWVEATFSSSRGSYSGKEEYMTVRNETNDSLAVENQVKQLNIQSISGSPYWTNWDADAEKDGFELSPYFKDTSGEQVYPNSKDWIVTVKIYNAEVDYSKYKDFSTHKLELVNTLTMRGNDVQYDTTLGKPSVRVPDEALEGLNVGSGQFVVEAEFRSSTYGVFELRTETFDRRDQ
ncbi:MAG: S-layer homology domain-containing protein [Candidatus Peribacteraceae bacterium]|nr:S-layer homology domain-containing protein [Candidatus Peribacteraceae bacterium]